MHPELSIAIGSSRGCSSAMQQQLARFQAVDPNEHLALTRTVQSDMLQSSLLQKMSNKLASSNRWVDWVEGQKDEGAWERLVQHTSPHTHTDP